MLSPVEPALVRRLILFDIDGTLLITRGLGIRAMELAGQDLFGPAFSAAGLDFAGGLDPVLLDQLMVRNTVAPSDARRAAFRARYAERLDALFRAGAPASALPGVHALLARLRDLRCAMGLLTGNFRETGVMKLAACAIDPGQFDPAVWGDHSPHPAPCRDHLPPVAIERFCAARGVVIDPANVVIIGDTPHDVACALASGCRVIGVATGKYSRRQLAEAGAHSALDDLSATDDVLSLLASV